MSEQSAIEKVVAHFSKQGLKKTHVEEWGLDVYYKPLTLSERHKINEASEFNPSFSPAYTLIYKALDEDGKRLFKTGDAAELKKSSVFSVVTTVAAKITGAVSEDGADGLESDEERAKNS